MRSHASISPTFGVGLYASAEPGSWTDHNGRTWKTLRISRRIKYRYPAALALADYVFHRDKRQCKGCGKKHDLLLDHIISRRCGGSHHPANLQILCGSCNSSKANRVDAKRCSWSDSEWRKYFGANQ